MMGWFLFVTFMITCAVLLSAGSFMMGLMIGTANTAAEAARMADDIEHGRRITP